MMNQPIKRGPDIQKSNLKLVNKTTNIKSLATETHDFRSKSYYDEHGPNTVNNDVVFPDQAYQVKKKRQQLAVQQQYDFPDEDVKDDFEEQEEDVPQEKFRLKN